MLRLLETRLTKRTEYLHLQWYTQHMHFLMIELMKWEFCNIMRLKNFKELIQGTIPTQKKIMAKFLRMQNI